MRPSFGVVRVVEADARKGRGCLRMERCHRSTGDILVLHMATTEGGAWLTVQRPYTSTDAIRMREAAGV